MNKIVRESYPVSSLPDDLRVGLDPHGSVRVIVEERPAVSDQGQRLIQLLNQARQAQPLGDDPVSRIRKLRDEWDS